jgi:hypothetical protein
MLCTISPKLFLGLLSLSASTTVMTNAPLVVVLTALAKDDAVSQLSDQLMALTTRLQELERKQQTTISA